MKRIVASAIAATLVAAVAVLAPTAAHARGPEIGGSGSTYYLNDNWSGSANIEFNYGKTGDRAYVGDWDGNGTDTLAVRRGSTYYMTNSKTGGAATAQFNYGKSNDVTLVGDWNGDGKDTLVVRRGNVYHFANSLRPGPADAVIAYGRASDQVLVGDWNGDGKDTLAVRRGNVIHFSNTIRSGAADMQVGYGKADDKVYSGDWDGNGTDTAAVRRGNVYFIKNSFSGGVADKQLPYGRTTDNAIIGDWNGDGTDTLGVRRHVTPSASQAWANRTFGTFTTTTYRGTGSDVISLPAGAEAGMVTASHNGSSNFVVWTRAGGELDSLLVNEIGSYKGTTAFAGEYATPDDLRITADGDWTITVAPIGTAPELSRSGTGDKVFLYSGKRAVLTARHFGEGNFIVVQAQDDYYADSVFINEIGNYSGSVGMAAGPSIIMVVADGSWTFSW